MREERKGEDVVEFKWLEAKPIGSNIVLFKLEDGATVKVKIDIERAGVAVNYRNPDGSLHYNIAFNQNVSIIPADRTFKVPRSILNMRKPPSITYG